MQPDQTSKTSLASRVLSMIHAFSDDERRDEVRKLASSVAELESDAMKRISKEDVK